MLGTGLSLPDIARSRRVPADVSWDAAIHLSETSPVTGTDPDVISVMSAGTSGVTLSAIGSGGAVQKVSNGFRFSAGKYLHMQNFESDWEGAFVVCDITRLANPATSAFLLRLCTTKSARFVLRGYANGLVSAFGPDNVRMNYVVQPYGTRQKIAFLAQPGPDGLATGSTMNTIDVDGSEQSGGSVALMTPLTLTDIRIGQNENMILHEISVYSIRAREGLPAPAMALWAQ